MQYATSIPNILSAILISSIAILFALAVHRIFFAAARRISRRTGVAFDDSLLRHSERPTKLILPLLAFLSVSLGLRLPERAVQTLRHAAGLVLIAAIAWLLVSLLNLINDVLAARYRIDIEDNLRARRIRTQVQVLRRVLIVVITIVTVAIILMTFPSVRHLGVSLFASAGLAALVAGLAARPTLSSLIAGLQIALTEPIRLDDVVIVQGEWGRIEEITTTYVVIRIWDDRRLIVPLEKFIEEPFQNWTRNTSNLLGTVFLYTDYTVPVEGLRSELHRILKETHLWDGRVWGLQVTNTSDSTIELRALVSASNSSTAFDLRCYVREKMIAYLQSNHPESLPRVRTEFRAESLSGLALDGFNTLNRPAFSPGEESKSGR
jgi:small-conductance mechanosensitive channel